jgi:hypothetical protein
LCFVPNGKKLDLNRAIVAVEKTFAQRLGFTTKFPASISVKKSLRFPRLNFQSRTLVVGPLKSIFSKFFYLFHYNDLAKTAPRILPATFTRYSVWRAVWRA